MKFWCRFLRICKSGMLKSFRLLNSVKFLPGAAPRELKSKKSHQVVSLKQDIWNLSNERQISQRFNILLSAVNVILHRGGVVFQQRVKCSTKITTHHINFCTYAHYPKVGTGRRNV